MGLNTYDDLKISKTPELVFGLVGPIGVDIALIEDRLVSALESVRYSPVKVRITKLMQQIDTDISLKDEEGPFEYYKSRMDYANSVRKKCENNSALAALSILAIKNHRQEVNEENKTLPADERGIPLIDCPLSSTAYIIRQFKTKEEVSLMRAVYGKKFVQISVHASHETRLQKMTNDISLKNPELDPEKIKDIATDLIKRDKDEENNDNGQRLGKIFHLGDVFVDATSEKTISNTVPRFIKAFFGHNSISPTKDEYGSYIAASASLRTLDPSRQVGAAIFSTEGEVISLGSNEVPKYGGGTYWGDEDNPHRDFDDRRSPNFVRKNRMFYDLLSRLNGIGALKDSTELKKAIDTTDDDVLKSIMAHEGLDGALLNDITEYGRMTHAEMNAITDAARLGIATKNATLFSTTFPCHNCAKHIVASGIIRVVYIEPYPKSQAVHLNGDSISLDIETSNKVIFENFVGISPRRYRDIFEKGKRRDSSGNYKEWYEGDPAPRVLDRGAGYVLNENSAILSALDKVGDEIELIGES